jgi:sec-independent protein translocase protein TatA
MISLVRWDVRRKEQFMPSWIGPWEIAIVLVLALVIFGPRKLPELGSSLGKSIRGFRKGLKEGQDEVKSTVAEVRQATGLDEVKSAVAEVRQAVDMKDMKDALSLKSDVADSVSAADTPKSE